MTFQQMKELCTVAECESITKAAEKLFISQPALSMALKKIETEVGVPLFDHAGRYTYLNEAGKAVYAFASETLSAWDSLLNSIREKQIEDENIIRLCFTSDYISSYVIPAFVSNYPTVDISIQLLDDSEIGGALLRGNYDIAISRQQWTDNETIESMFFYRTKLLVSIPLSNPLSENNSLKLKDLVNEKIVRISRKGESTTEVNELAEKEKLQLKTMKKINYEAIKQLQSSFDFVYFLTSLQAEFDYNPANRRLVPLEEPQFSRDLFISYKKSSIDKLTPFLGWVRNRWGHTWSQ